MLLGCPGGEIAWTTVRGPQAGLERGLVLIRVGSATRRVHGSLPGIITRARQGMITFVPLGDTRDPTRSLQAMTRTVDSSKTAASRLSESRPGAIHVPGVSGASDY